MEMISGFPQIRSIPGQLLIMASKILIFNFQKSSKVIMKEAVLDQDMKIILPMAIQQSTVLQNLKLLLDIRNLKSNSKLDK